MFAYLLWGECSQAMEVMVSATVASADGAWLARTVGNDTILAFLAPAKKTALGSGASPYGNDRCPNQ